MTTQSNTQLPLLQKEHGGTQFIAFNERNVEMPQQEGTEPIQMYEYDSVRTPIGADYGTLVTAIIRTRYTSDQVEAIVLNHGDGNPDHEAEYNALQQWRTEAKHVAKLALRQQWRKDINDAKERITELEAAEIEVEESVSIDQQSE